jgi:hypothetical protein
MPSDEIHANLLYLKPGYSLKTTKTMKKSLLILAVLFMTLGLSAQNDCYKKLEDAFAKRGAYGVGDDMHRNVIISFFDKNGNATCASGKARVENGQIVSILVQYDDGTYEPYEKKFFNEKKQLPYITNGISDMTFTADGEKFKVIFIDKLKPKQKAVKEVALPDDL